MTPAQCTNACTDVSSDASAAIKAATESRSLMSHSRTTREASGTSVRMAAAADSSRSADLPTRCTRAPNLASSFAVAAPNPDDAPVTTMSMGEGNGVGSAAQNRRRTVAPMREYPGTTALSRIVSSVRVRSDMSP